MIRVTQLDKTCYFCPSQWEGVTADGAYVYIRYRCGWLSARVGGEVVAGLQAGHEYDGVMDDAQMARLLAPWLDFAEVR